MYYYGEDLQLNSMENEFCFRESDQLQLLAVPTLDLAFFQNISGLVQEHKFH